MRTKLIIINTFSCNGVTKNCGIKLCWKSSWFMKMILLLFWGILYLKTAETDWGTSVHPDIQPSFQPHNTITYFPGIFGYHWVSVQLTTSDISPKVSSSSASPLGASSLPLHLHPQLLLLLLLISPLLSTPLIFPLLVPTVAWQVTDDANNSGCGRPCSAEHKPHDKLPSSVCFANSPHRSPPRPVVTFYCVLYMQIPANQLARHSAPPSLPTLPIVIKMNWLWAKVNTGQPAKKSPGVNGTQRRKWWGGIQLEGNVVSSLSPHFTLFFIATS